MRIALLQAEPCHDVDECLSLLDTHLGAAKAQNADLLVTPEMWLGGYNIAPQLVTKHADQYYQMAHQISQIVARHAIALVIGCATPGPGKPHNTAVAFDGTGNLVGDYAKCQLFGDLDRERFTPGDTVSSVFTLADLRVGMAICYDIEFPETARALALQGAELIIVPTANMVPYDSVNHRLVPARAEENGVFVAYTNLCGAEGDLQYCGLSCLCGPDGEILALGGTGVEMVFADIDPAAVAQTQRDRPYLNDRRAEIYVKKD